VFANVNRKIVETIADVSLWIIIAAVISAIVALLALVAILKKVKFSRIMCKELFLTLN
jgi:hypothetical protein